MRPLTPEMLKMLAACALAPTSPWDFGAGVVGGLKKRGLIVGAKVDKYGGGKTVTLYTLTPAGEAALKAGS